ncbi:MAG TPA: GntR family transcriptional regulator [Verrucomicrobiae bacterium]|nr:GntR family transcriptional regulator [Verrucomicrobiae bacterium]
MPAAVLLTRLSDQAYGHLRDLIVSLELEPGSLIAERETMAALGVGRTPLREALHRLAHDGLVEVVPRRGHFVSQVSLTDLTHVFELRQAIEGLSARLAARRATGSDRAALGALLRDARQLMNEPDSAAHLELDRRFHGLVADASRNGYIREDVERLFALSVRIQRLSGVPITTIEHELTNYEGVVSAIDDGDPDSAESWMCRHLDPSDPDLHLRHTGSP